MLRVLSKREKLILYTTVGVITLSVIFNLGLAPILIKDENLNKQINITRAKLKKYLILLGQKDYIQNKYDKFPDNFKGLIAKEDTLVSLANASNIRIIDIRPQGVTKGSNLSKEISIDLRTEAHLEDYLKFIYNLENSLSLLRIKRFQLTAKPNTHSLEGNFSISVPSVSE